MSLSTAFNTAQSIFNNTATATSTVSKNLANQGNANYSRRAAVTGTTLWGASIIKIERAQDQALLRQVLTSTSQNSAQQELTAGLKGISEIFGGNDKTTAPSTHLTTLLSSLATYAATPSSSTLGTAVVNNAQNLVNSLTNATEQLQQIRRNADKDISLSVDKLNDLLQQFQVANDAASSASAAGLDPNDAMDMREGVLKQISEIVGVTTMNREPNDLVLYTSDGTTLFESSARKVTFQPTFAYGATVVGAQVKIDGVPVAPGTGGNTSAQGSLGAMLQLRDQIAPVMQKQLDEVARGLITAFSEKDGSVPAVVKPGLFTWSGGTVPPAGTAVPDLASRIMVNPAVVPPSGSPTKLRDGSINGAAFNKNTANAASYSATLSGYTDAVNAAMAFDPTTEIDPNTSLKSFATKSIGWLEDIRSTATTALDSKDAMMTRAVEAYSNATGVDLNEELSLMLDLEHSFSASGKLLSTIDEMLKNLLNAVG